MSHSNDCVLRGCLEVGYFFGRCACCKFENSWDPDLKASKRGVQIKQDWGCFVSESNQASHFVVGARPFASKVLGGVKQCQLLVCAGS